MNYHLIGYTIGLLLCLVGLAAMIPAIADYQAGSDNATSFLLSGLFALFIGGSLVFSNLGFEKKINVRGLFLTASLAWLSTSAFGALPLWSSDLGLSLIDSFFEAVSGTTTTGATILPDLDKASEGLKLWRSLLQWMGGAGTLIFVTLFLPYLQVGGMQFFRFESSEQSGKIMPRSTSLALSLMAAYACLSALCAVSYKISGMSWFDALNHAMTTLSTGGFSVYNDSFAHFDSPLIYSVATFFMFASALPFILYLRFFLRKKTNVVHDEQFQVFTAMVFVFVTLIALWLFWTGAYPMGESFLYAAFNIVSIISTTGYWNIDYTDWGPFPVMCFFFLIYLGACTGSTTGGLKVMRVILLAKIMLAHLKGLIYPHGVFVLRYQGQTIEKDVIMTVLGFVCLYVLTNTILTVALSWTGLELETAISASASAIANVGPGIGDIIGPGGNYASLPDTAKSLLCLGMLTGRLEILTLFVIFTHRFWKN